MHSTSAPGAPGTSLRWSLVIFGLVSFAGAWLVCIPLWQNGGGITSPLLGATASAMMFTPLVAVVITWLVTRPRGGRSLRELAWTTGLSFGPNRRRTAAVIAAVWVGIPVFVVITTLICALLGLYRLDLETFSLLGEEYRLKTGKAPNPQAMLITSIGAVALTPLLNALPSFGEELGWRGWLFPNLLRYGPWAAILITGAVWGLWHAPLTLLGYNYAMLGPWSALMFIPFCIAFGAVLAWTRWFTGSVWPAVVGHGVFNGSTGLVLLLGASGQQVNFALVGPISVVGIVLFAIIAAVLFAVTRPGADPDQPAESVPSADAA